jgi:hypothetical protein
MTCCTRCGDDIFPRVATVSGATCLNCWNKRDRGESVLMKKTFTVKPETQARLQRERAEQQAANRIDLLARLDARAATDPEGDAGIWAEMARDLRAAAPLWAGSALVKEIR